MQSKHDLKCSKLAHPVNKAGASLVHEHTKQGMAICCLSVLTLFGLTVFHKGLQPLLAMLRLLVRCHG